MTRRILLATFGLVLFLVFAVALWPARIAADWFLPAGVGLAGVDGTLWEGSASALSIGRTGLGSLEWDSAGAGLLMGRPAWRLRLVDREAFARGLVRVGGAGDLELQDVELSARLESLPGRLSLGGVAGALSARLERFVVEDGRLVLIRGRGEAARVTPPGVEGGDLGTLEVVFPGTPEAPLTGSFTATEGPLLVEDGMVAVEPDGRYQVSARVTAGPGAPPWLQRAMEFLGSPDPEGYRQFGFSGSL